MLKDTIEEKSWEEFRETGLLWFINSILHLFGWIICFDVETGKGFPARTVFRGFSSEINDKGYEQVSHYLLKNMGGLYVEGFMGNISIEELKDLEEFKEENCENKAEEEEKEKEEKEEKEEEEQND